MKKRAFCFYLLVFSFCFRAYAQEQSPPKDVLGKYRISTQVLQYFVQDITLNVERVFGRHSFGVLGSYRFTGRSIDMFSEDEEATFAEDNHSGITAGINSKYRLNKRSPWYIEGQFFYRHWWYDDSPWYIEKIDVFCIKGLVGYPLSITKRGRIRPLMTFYAGLGLRTRNRKKEWISYDNTAHYFQVRPSVQLGFSLGMAIFDKN